jgi:hypothetical protein
MVEPAGRYKGSMIQLRSLVRRVPLASVILAAACGGNVAVETSGAAGGGGSNPGSSASSASSSNGSGTASSSSSTGPGTGGGGGAGPNNAVYTADAYPGGLDHLLFKKADPVRNICVQLHMAAPHANAPGFAFTLPAMWGIASARVTDKASDCDAPWPGGGANTVSADGGQGVVSFTVPPGGYFPCDLSVHATLVFPAGPAWVPVQEPLDADMVPITGGCF